MGENKWRDYDAWPPSSMRVEEWHLRSGGRATSLSGDGALAREQPAAEPPDVYVYNPALPVSSLGGRSCCAPELTPPRRSRSSSCATSSPSFDDARRVHEYAGPTEP